MIKQFGAALLIGAALMVGACGGKVTPKAETKAVAFEATKKTKVRYVCGAKTKADGLCQHPVKHEGELCWVHKAVVPCTTDSDCEEKNGR